MKKIAVITSTRAEYGILHPLIQRIDNDPELSLKLIVTGTHLSDKYGRTVSFIEKDGFPIAEEIPILEEENDAFHVSLTMANALSRFAACFRDMRPDMAVILGDRTEMLAVAEAAMIAGIPIAHLHGGELTEGAVDDCVRHSITKMSFLHFTSAEQYRKRVIQLGEEPSRVFNVGALSTENILHAPLLSEEETRRSIGLPDAPGGYAMVTFHPVTLERGTEQKEVAELCRAMESFPDICFVITMANADAGSDSINRMMARYAAEHGNGLFVSNLGMIRYLSGVKYAALVLGNSSSGIIEAPVLGTPTVNIGDRQKGRIMADSVICCPPDAEAIREAIARACRMEHRPDYLYGDGTTSEKIVSVMKRFLENGIRLKKKFYDIDFEIERREK